MKALRVSLLVLLLSAMAFAVPSFQCNQPVNDLAGVLGSKAAQVAQAASTLNSHGADTRIATVVLNGYANLDAWAVAAVKNCPSMQNPSGGTKTTLIILAAVPAQFSPDGKAKMGIYAGTAFESAFGADRMLRYKTEFMRPHFKAQEWAEGLIAAADQMANRLAAYTSEVNTPITNTTTTNTVNEASKPTDLGGLWVFFWILGAIGVVVVVFGIFLSRKKSKEDGEEAQQSAIAARTRVTNLMNDLTSALAVYAGNFTGKPGAAKANSMLDEVSRQFADLASKLSGDPTQEGLGAGTYRSLGQTYSGMASRLIYADNYLATPEQDPSTYVAPKASVSSTSPFVASPTSSTPGHRHSHTHQYSDPIPIAAPNSSGDFVDGVVLGSVLGSRSPSYGEPDRPYIAPTPEPEFASRPESEPQFTEASGSSDIEKEESPMPAFTANSGSSDFEKEEDEKPSFTEDSGSSVMDSVADAISDISSSFSTGSGSDDV